MIAVVGGFGVGMTMRLDRAPDCGETVTGGILTVGPGGKGSNQAIAMARLGQASALLTAVGLDVAASEARQMWRDEGVDASGVVARDAATMTGFILVDAAGENRIAIAPGALDSLTARDADAFRSTIRHADLLVVSLEVPWPLALRALEIAHDEGTSTLLNPAPATPQITTARGLVGTLIPNATEARVLVGAENGRTDEQLAIDLSKLMDCNVVMTLGSRGAIVVENGHLTPIEPCLPTGIVDTTGAGDAFTAALAVAMVEGMPLTEAARWAAAAGAHAVGIAEVIPALPHRRDLDALTRTTDKEPV